MRSTTERGMGGEHQAKRRWYQARMDRGERFECSRHFEPYCPRTPVDPNDWELDHTDDRRGWLGPSHPPCNAYAGRVKFAAERMTIREW